MLMCVDSDESEVLYRGIWVIDEKLGMKIACYVTNNQERVLSLRGTKDALGFIGGGSGAVLRNLNTNWIKPYLSDDLKEWIVLAENKQLPTISSGARIITPISADLFVDVLKSYINAQKDGVFKKDDRLKISDQIANRAFLIMTAFAKVGLVSIIDEVTGYQYEREAQELQKLLSKYVAKELLPWTKRFPDQFYEEMYRLNGWGEFKGGKNKHPRTGQFTNYIIYDRLPDIVVERLKKMVPVIENKDTNRRYRTKKLHSGLTDDGIRHLDTLIQQFIAVARGYDTFAEFDLHFRKIHKQPIQQSLL